MSKYLITPSLINSFSYYMKDEWKSPADSRADFLKTLSRERFEPNEAMQKGINFENDISDCCDDEYLYYEEYGDKHITPPHSAEYDNVVESISEIVKGGIWQTACKKDLEVKNKSFLLYGRCDVVKADTVYDIKYTRKYELGKFSDSIQHLIYMYCLDLDKFAYLVSDGKSFWREDYFADNLENRIKTKISEFLDYLDRDKEARDMFYNKWSSK